MQPTHERLGFRFAVAITALLTLTAMGTLGYVVVEGAPWFDALYMTVITLSTVGFGEVIPLSTAGRAFTMLLILSGVGMAAYFVTSVMQLLAVDVLTKIIPGKSMQDEIDRLSGHIIVCGYGRLGAIVVEELARGGALVVIVEQSALKQAELQQSSRLHVIGNATSDEVLQRAGIDRARAIVAGTGSDPDNVFITLAARERRRDIRIHARGESAESIRRLKQAGADYVLSAYHMGGLSLAASLLRPSVAQFLEIARPRSGQEVDIEEVVVPEHALLIGRTLQAVEQDHQRLRIVALMRNERIDLLPAPEVRVQAGDALVVIGERKSLERLASLAARA